MSVGVEPHANRLEPPLDAAHDHALGDARAGIALLEFGSYTCPYCHAAHAVMADLRDRFGERMRYAFRHRPTTGDPDALRAAELAEYAHETVGRFWDAHDALMTRGPKFTARDFDAVAAELDLPVDDAAARARAREAVQADIASAQRSGVRYTPTFYINNRRYDGPWDESSLSEAMLGSLGHRVHSAALDFARWAPSSGLALLAMLILALAAANSPFGPAVEAFWNMPVGLRAGDGGMTLTLRGWINDGLLTVFFLVVGLEIKREFTVGRLSTVRAAALPVAASIGGMLAPAILYLAIVPPGPLAHGWAIPTTTDTAFAIALIALLGSRVPIELRVFLTAAVIVDDLVAIAIVAVFYSGALHPDYLVASVAVTGGLIMLNRWGVYRPLPYGLLGILLWVCLHHAGLHATLAGVILAVVTPTRPPANLRALLAQAETVLTAEMRQAGGKVLRHGPSEPALRALDAIHARIESPADTLLRTVEPWASYFVLPLFALANAGLVWSMSVVAGHERLMLAILAGLVLGKPVGIVLAAAAAVWLRLAIKPAAYTWRQLCGAGALAGIGFTMSLFIAAQAFADAGDFAAAKLAVVVASFLAAGLGCTLLWRRPAAATEAARGEPAGTFAPVESRRTPV